MPLHSGLSDTTVCYVSTGGYGGVWRTVKQAHSLIEAGARVVIVGYEGFVPAALTERPMEAVLVGPPTRTSTNPVRALRVAANLTVNRWYNAQYTKPRDPEAWRRYHGGLIDAVVATGAHVVQGVDLVSLDVAHEAAQRLGAKLIYASHELWSGFVNNPDMNLSPEMAACLLRTERELIGKADLVTVTSDLMGERLAQAYSIKPPLTLLNAPSQRVDVARPIHSPVRLVYHGGLSADRNIDGLIRAMALLKNRATLDIHGFSRTVAAAQLSALVGELGLEDRVRLHGAFEYLGLVELLRDYDVGVMTAKVVEENFAVTLPNKIFDCMCAGLAVAMNESPAVKAVLNDVPFGVLLDPASPETIAAGLDDLLGDPERIMAMKRRAVEDAPRYWWPEQGRKLVTAVSDMLFAPN